MNSEQPSKAAKVLMFLCGFACIVMISTVVCAILGHAYAVNEAERRWKETDRKQIEETNRLIKAYNAAVEKRNFEKELISLKEAKKDIEKQKRNLDKQMEREK